MSVPKVKELTSSASSNVKLTTQISATNIIKKSAVNTSISHASGSGFNMVRSLNLAVRKRETERIEREN
jgi:hypothetical protein